MSLELSGVLPGVWRCRAYARHRREPSRFSRRGAVEEAVLADAMAWFLVDRERWAASLVPRGASAAWTALEAARAAVDEEFGARWRALAGPSKVVVASMANGPHVDLALNMVYSVRRAGWPAAIVFALSEGASRSLSASGVESMLLPASGDLDTHRDVQTRGFGAIAAMKAVSVLCVLRAGLGAWWLDTDVVALGEPPSATFDVVFQSGGLGPHDRAAGEAHFHVEACTGVFYVAAKRPPVEKLFEAVILELRVAYESDLDWFGDQAATNLAIFEHRFRDGLADLTVGLLDHVEAPGGGLFFDGGLDRAERAFARLAHNNFVVGKRKKLDRFEKYGLWFAQSHPSFLATPCAVPCRLARVLLGNARPLARYLFDDAPEDDGDVVYSVDPARCELAKRAIAVVSLGPRPWFPALRPRIVAYGRRLGVDVVVAKGGCASSPNFDACAKAHKLRVAARLLGLYERLLLLDDTVAVRADAPDVFALVPPVAVGATVEDATVRADARALLDLARMSFDPTFCLDDFGTGPDEPWLNSGVLVLSWLHVPLLDRAPDVADDALYWDQVRPTPFCRPCYRARRPTSTPCASGSTSPSSTSASPSITLAPSRLPIAIGCVPSPAKTHPTTSSGAASLLARRFLRPRHDRLAPLATGPRHLLPQPHARLGQPRALIIVASSILATTDSADGTQPTSLR